VQWLHRGPHDTEKILGQRLELDLGAETAPELRDRVLGVVAAAVEAAVDRALHVGSEGAEGGDPPRVEAATINGDSSGTGRIDCNASTARRYPPTSTALRAP